MTSQGLRRAGLKVLIGSGLGFGISFLLTPVLTRLYSPAVFGEFSTIVAVGTALVGLSTLRLEVLAQSESEDTTAHSLVRLAVISSLIASVVAASGAFFAVLLGHAGAAWWALGPVVFAGSLQLIGTAVLARRAAYGALGGANFVQGAGTGIVQVALGSIGSTILPLFVGFLVPRGVWFGSFGRLKRPRSPEPTPTTAPPAPLRMTWLAHRKFAAIAGSSAGLNSVAGQALILLTSLFYGSAMVGALAIALRVLVGPLGIIGQAVASASIGEIGSAMRTGRPARSIVRDGVRDLLIVGIVPCGFAMVVGPTVAPLALSEWRAVGPIIAWLAIGALFQFAVAPFSSVLNMSHRNWDQFRWDIWRLGVLALSLLVPHLLGYPLTAAVAAYSICQVGLYLDLLRRVLRAIG